MPSKRIRTYFLRSIAAGLAVAALFAAQQRGVVKSGGLPIPGATVTASMDGKKVVTTTDDQGAYVFPDLPEGVWTLQVDMLGFTKASREIGVMPDAPAAEWDLTLLSPSAVAAQLTPQPQPAPAAPKAAAAESATTERVAAGQPRGDRNQAANQGARGGRNLAAGRGGRNGGNNGQPSLMAEGGFQQVGVNQSADSSLFNQEGVISSETSAELAPSANQAFVVQGSQSSAMEMPGMADFGPFGGRGGPGGMMMGAGPGMGGPGMEGMGGPGMGGEGSQVPAIAEVGARGGEMAGGPGGAGGFGGGPGGGPMMGGGGRGGFGGGPGGFGGRGGAGGGRGGPGGGRGTTAGRGGRGAYMARPGAMAFGNNRRNPRMMYTANLAINEQNSLLNAQKYSLTGANLGNPYMNRTNVTANIGGPFKIPKLLDGSKGQFQLNVTIGRNRNGQAGQLTTMPTPLERSGDFSQSVGSNGKPVIIYDPTNNAPFPNNKIDPTRISPIAQALLKYYPGANISVPDSIRNYQMATTTLSNQNSINARVNQTLTSKNRLNVSFGYQGSNSTSPNSLAFIDPLTGNAIVDTGSGRSMNAGVSWAHNFSTRVISNFGITFSRQRNLSSPYFSGLTDVESALGIQGVAVDPTNWGPPNLSFTNFGALSSSTASLNRNQTTSVTESLMWVRQKHTFGFGAAFRRQQINTENNSNPRGRFTFNGSATSLYVDAQGNPVSSVVDGKPKPGTGFDLADFMLGVPDTASLQCGGATGANLCNGSPAYYFRGSVWSLYAQDDWRLSPGFSMNLGVRWDYQTGVNELNNQMVNLAFAPNFTSYAQVTPGGTDPFTGQRLSDTLVNPDRNNFSPRFGIAWKPSQKHSTVIRGGYGISFNTGAYSSMAQRLSQQPPLARSLNLSVLNNLSALEAGTLTMANAFINSVNTLTANTYAVDPNYKIGYAQSWQLMIQQNLPYSFQTSVGYSGTKGTNLDRQFEPWVQPPGATAAPYPSGYTYETYGNNSSYHAANVRMMRRFSSGISASATYSFQKYLAITNPAQNWLDFKSQRANMVGPHSLAISASYSTGQGRYGAGLMTGWKGALVKDWTIATTISVSSGSPLTPTCSGNSCLAVGSTNIYSRPMYTGVSIAPVAPGYYFNPAAFVAPAAGTWGNAGIGVIPGPLGYSLNGQAGRVFRLGERRSADLQIRANNVLNTVIINGYDTRVGSNTYGEAINTANMRTVTASLRFRF